MQEFFYNGVKRLDWGFGNPNITAGLIATLLMAVWGLAFIHRWGFWPALLGFTTLGVCLIQTVSRGGMVAAVLAGLALVACLRRPWPRGRWIPVVAAIFFLGAYAFWHGVATRYGKGIVEEDASVSNRWLIYRMAPAMMVDAPGGWGHNRASEAFHKFYQIEGDQVRYGSLVSSHLTWMAEWNWLERTTYVAAWLFVYVVCLPNSKRRWYSVVFATWIAFGAAAMFTMMANRWLLWIVPGVLFVAVFASMVISREWRSRAWIMGIVGGGTSFVMAAIFVWGAFLIYPSPQIELRSGWVRIGSREGTSTWIVSPDPSVLGKSYGSQLRQIVERNGAVKPMHVFVSWESGKTFKQLSGTIVFSGEWNHRLLEDQIFANRPIKTLIFINPSASPDAFGKLLPTAQNIRVFFGEFYRGGSGFFWQEAARRDPRIAVERVKSIGWYMPEWDILVSDALQAERQVSHRGISIEGEMRADDD